MIKLQHTIVNINGLRYVQLKSCLLKWPPHQKNWPLLESQNRDLQDLSLPKPSPLHGSIFPLHSTMFYAVALVNTSSKDSEISLDRLARENPKERKNSPFLV